MQERSAISRKLLLSLGILGAAGAVAGLGTYAQFTASTSADHAISTGKVSIDLGTPATVTVTEFADGDSVSRPVDLKNTSTIALAGGITLATSNTGDGALLTDANGLHVSIQTCASTWTGSAPTFTCGGTAQDVLTDTKVDGISAATLSNLTTGTNHLLITTSLPHVADDSNNNLENKTATVSYTFNAVQRAGEAR